MKVKDAFAFKELLKVMEEWFEENGYKPRDGGDIAETTYTHKISQGGNWLDSWLWWRYLKYPLGGSPKTSYYRYGLNVDMHYLGNAAEVEVMNKGKKVSLMKGEVEFTINAFLELDFRNEWSKKGGFLSLVHDVFRKKMYKKEIESQKEYVYAEMYDFQGVIKQFFKLEKFVSPEVVSLPPKGLME
jgi:hypothetical protein